MLAWRQGSAGGDDADVRSDAVSLVANAASPDKSLADASDRRCTEHVCGWRSSFRLASRSGELQPPSQSAVQSKAPIPASGPASLRADEPCARGVARSFVPKPFCAAATNFSSSERINQGYLDATAQLSAGSQAAVPRHLAWPPRFRRRSPISDHREFRRVRPHAADRSFCRRWTRREADRRGTYSVPDQARSPIRPPVRASTTASDPFRIDTVKANPHYRPSDR